MSEVLNDTEQTPGDQIIEINSNSTTSSEEYKRKKINSKHQLKLFLHQQTFNSHKNKCSTETTSDFPVSSPSNQYDRPGPPQKNTLSTDNFELSLALLTTQTPQMSLEEKINSWKCDLDPSDVEDVDNFDDLFKQHEELKQKKRHYDFSEFRNKVVPRIKASTSFKEKNDKLSNCSIGVLSAQRRMRAALEFECKKRQHLEMLMVDCSETPTFTSSSENEMVYNSEEKVKGFDGLQSGKGIPPHKPLGDIVMDLNGPCKNKVIDRNNQKNDSNSQGLIQMRLDFAIQNKSQHLQEKKKKLFKTPTVRQDYPRNPVPIHLPMILNSKINCSHTKINYKNTNVEHQCKEYYIPMQNSLRETDQNCSTFSFSSRATTSPANFHQQHEFCNYLGLTGMSTANAVANAVAELAKCNLTRRSLRVRRLMQQEKKEHNRKSIKTIAKGDEFLKKIRCEGKSASPICERQNEMMLSHIKNAEDASVKKFGKLTQSRSTIMDKGSKADIPVVKNVSFEKDPEIKIVCKMSNPAKETPIEKCSKELSAPLHQNLLRYDVKPNYSNDTSTCPRSSISDVIDEIISDPTPNILRNRNNNLKSDLRPTPTQTSTCSSFKDTISKPVVKPDVIKHQLHDKFKKYLDASRKVKPSIYIVQTLHNVSHQEHKQPKKKVFVDVGVETSQKRKINDKIVDAKQQVLLQSKRQHLSLLSHQRKTERLGRLLALATSWRQRQNHRQIYNRRTSFFKKKSASNTCGKATKKKTKSNQSGNCRTTSLSKSYKSNNQGRKNRIKQVNKARVTSRALPSPADAPVDQHDPKTATKMTAAKKLRATTTIGLRRERCKSSLAEGSLFDPIHPVTSNTGHERLETTKSIIENETVVVSSTTNSYDEATLLNLNKSPSQSHREVTAVQKNGFHTILTKDQSTESAPPLGIYFIHPPKKELANPVKAFNGRIDYVYYEMDVLIVVQEKIVSFWKYFKLINVLAGSKESENYSPRGRNEESYLPSYMNMDEASPQWVPLGECRRITTDMEISTSYANRLCVHNSIPIYIEMRCREIPRDRRDCNLLSMYINVYYFNDEDMVAKMHSIQLDAVQGIPSDVVYTTITDSRYFVMSWPHENILGKPRSGLCKYSLTPNLDTLASIRDFKHMRHRIRYLECSTDGKLIGFGDTQLTIWDHRSGDVLMNYDFNIKLGHNLGSIYYPSLEIGQDSMLILFQYKRIVEAAEVFLIACSVSHTSPSHRILKRLKMPNLAFNTIQNAINTGDNMIITAENDEEIWINCTDPTIITRVPPQHSRRFYQRGKSHIIELTSKSLLVDSFANHILKLAANQTFYYDKAQV